MHPVTVKPAEGSVFPQGVLRMDYVSDADGHPDWAMLWPGRRSDLWIVVIHGHGARGDQLFTRQDIRERKLPEYRATEAGLLCPNLRGNAWMGPSAAADMRDLLAFLRAEHGMRKVIFSSGSMGATSNLIFAALHPGDVSGVVARAPATDLASYHAWCRQQAKPVVHEIAAAIEAAYGGTPGRQPALYARHSALHHADRLVTPVALAHAADDDVIPVSQARALAGAMSGRPDFLYNEIPGGGHDAPDAKGFQYVLTRVR